ncbi:hypothetical protein FG870_05135 [Enterococcus faecalis]|nr:hypothetical protein [Enterococcus faecalis]
MSYIQFSPSMSTVAWSFVVLHDFLKKNDVKQYLASEVSEVSFDSSTLHIVNQVQLHHQNQEVK